MAVRGGLLLGVSVLATLVLTLQPNDAVADDAPQSIEFFERHIRPLLAEKCYQCHSSGAKNLEGGLQLDSATGIAAGGDGGAIVIPGRASASRLWQALGYEGDLQMPPDAALDEQSIEYVRSWIDAGAKMPDDLRSNSNLHGEMQTNSGTTHWAFRVPRRAFPPKVQQADWCQTKLDHFVLASLEANDLTPSPPAARATLLRRLYVDLVGLPPSANAIDHFIHDESPDAIERVVDELLGSPQYGERWGRHWLDVARYADTKDLVLLFGNDRIRPYAYTYRDYVVSAWNDDLPYDHFIQQQLAADLLDEDQRPQSLAALGFLNVGKMFDNNEPDIQDDRIDVVARGLMGLTVACARCHDHKYDPIPTADYYSLYGIFASTEVPLDLPRLATRLNGTATQDFETKANAIRERLNQHIDSQYEFLLDEARQRLPDYLTRIATTKPDPIENAVFFMSLSPEDLRPQLVVAWRRYVQQHSGADDPVFGLWGDLLLAGDESSQSFAERATRVRSQWLAKSLGVGPGQLNPRLANSLAHAPLDSPADVAALYGATILSAWQELKALASHDATATLSSQLASQTATSDPSRAQLLDILLGEEGPVYFRREHCFLYMSRVERSSYHNMQQELDKLAVESAAAPPRAMALQDAATPVEPRIFLRGNPTAVGRHVPRQFLELLSGPQRPSFQNGSGRRELAYAITSRDNPLTSRVIVNRIWMHHFGEPIVSTPSDFGQRGAAPTHPELLDDLAVRFQDDMQWSLKQLHREIVLSAAYQQTSDDRPDCRAVDPDNRLLWRANRRRLDLESMRDSYLAVANRLDNTLGGRPQDISHDASNRRRTLYGLVDRQELPGLYRAFDFASPDQSAARRSRTTTPQQALFGLNSEFILLQSQSVADQVLAAFDQDNQRVTQLFRRILGRTPSPDEQTAARQYVLNELGSHEKDEAASNVQLKSAETPELRHRRHIWAQLAQTLMLTNEFLYVD